PTATAGAWASPRKPRRSLPRSRRTTHRRGRAPARRWRSPPRRLLAGRPLRRRRAGWAWLADGRRRRTRRNLAGGDRWPDRRRLPVRPRRRRSARPAPSAGRTEDHEHRPPFHQGRALDDGRVREMPVNLLEHLAPELGVRQLPPAEADGHFDLIAFVEEARDRLDL